MRSMPGGDLCLNARIDATPLITIIAATASRGAAAVLEHDDHAGAIAVTHMQNSQMHSRPMLGAQHMSGIPQRGYEETGIAVGIHLGLHRQGHPVPALQGRNVM